MEVYVAEVKGLPEGTILSIRAGTTRRQAPLPITEPFRFPNLPFNAQNFKVDVMQTLGVARLDLNPLEMGPTVTLPIPLQDGSEASIQFSVREEPLLCGKRAAELKKFEMMQRDGNDDDAGSQEEKLRTAMEARAYARQHNLNAVMQEMLQYVLRSKPEAPYSLMADYFRSKAEEMGEVQGGNGDWSGGGAERSPVAPAQTIMRVDPSHGGLTQAPAVGVGGDIVDLPFELLDDVAPLTQATNAANVLEQALNQEDGAAWIAQEEGRAMPSSSTAGLDMERLQLEAEHVQLHKERAHLLRELADIEARQAAQCAW
mmetsp:Transcript_25184/g.57926  ORF Transcript_25184/g.57926 Transcript_25184/m.57926 type:complete len:315 (-) Transcript_25184:1-945(-)